MCPLFASLPGRRVRACSRNSLPFQQVEPERVPGTSLRMDSHCVGRTLESCWGRVLRKELRRRPLRGPARPRCCPPIVPPAPQAAMESRFYRIGCVSLLAVSLLNTPAPRWGMAGAGSGMALAGEPVVPRVSMPPGPAHIKFVAWQGLASETRCSNRRFGFSL